MAQEPTTLDRYVPSLPAERRAHFDNRGLLAPETLSPAGQLGFRYVAKQCVVALPLLLADLLGVTAAGLLGHVLIGGSAPAAWPTVAAFAACFAGVSGILGLYPAICFHPAVELRSCVRSALLTYLAFMAALLARARPEPAVLPALSIMALLSLGIVPMARLLARAVAARFALFTQPALIFGGGDEGAAAFAALQARPGCLLRPVGIIADGAQQWADETTDPDWYVGVPEEAAHIAARHGAYWAVVTGQDLSSARGDNPHAVAMPHRLRMVLGSSPAGQLWTDTRHVGSAVAAHEIDELLLPGTRWLKRAADLAMAAVLLVLHMPLMMVIAVWIKLTSPGPLLFAQRRIGLGGREFFAWKFRTMRLNADEVLDRYLRENPGLRREWQASYKLKNDPRVTRCGRFLRRTSLDELPQLFNVLKGDMSLVGPRPIVRDEISRYGNDFPRYARVRPGITGLWQVSGRNDTTYPQRVAFDAYYVENWSLWLDLWILLKTVRVVLLREGAY
ncbi:MAG: undecaprenyl-phosphate galactose phosphotransferase WbaP [Thermoguttaceae bacterium]|jgi:Undecaprenyl-phosphate galactose phosphotransferase WbaP